MKKNIMVIFLCILTLSCTTSLSTNYIPLSQVAQNSNLDIFWEPDTEKVYLTNNAHKYIFQTSKNYITLNEKIFFMPLPALRYNGEVYISKDFALPKVEAFPNHNDTASAPLSNTISNNRDNKQLESLVPVDREKNISENLQSIEKVQEPVHEKIANISAIDMQPMNEIQPIEKIQEPVHEKIANISAIDIQPMDKIQPIEKIQEPVHEKITRKSTLQTCDIIIDAGHGGKDPGASTVDFIEKDLNLQVAKEISVSLHESFSVGFTRKTDIYIPIKDRILASYNAKLLVSIHFNSTVVREVSGFEIWVSFKNFEKSISLAKILEKQLEMHTPLKNRGIRYNDFQIISQTQIPAILLECGFVTNEEDMKWFKNKKNIQLFSHLVANSIKKFFEKEEL